MDVLNCGKSLIGFKNLDSSSLTLLGKVVEFIRENIS